MQKLLLFLLSTTFFLFSLGQFAVLPLSVNIYVYDLVIALYVGLGFLYLLFSEKFKISGSHIFLILFLVWTFLSLLLNVSNYSQAQVMLAGAYFVRLALYLSTAFITYNLAKLDATFKQNVCLALLGTSLLIAFFGLIQLIVFPDLSTLPKELGWDPHINRLVSLFLDPNLTGGLLVLGFLLALQLFTQTKNVVYIALLGVLLLAIILTFSRSTWLMFAVVMLILGLLRFRILLVLTVCILFLSYYSIPRIQTRLSGVTDPNDSAALRLISWKNAATIIQDNLLIGVGYNAYGFVQDDYGFFGYKDLDFNHAAFGSDSSLLLILATTGLIGFVLFVGFIISNLDFYLRDYVSTSSLNSLFMIASIGALLVHSQFVNSLLFPPILLWWITLISLNQEA